VFWSGHDEFTVQEIMDGSLGVMGEDGYAVKVLDSLEEIVSGSEWFEPEGVLRRWGRPDEDVTGTSIRGPREEEELTMREIQYFGTLPAPARKDVLTRISVNRVYVVSFDGIVTTVTSSRERKSMQNYLDETKFTFGKIPLFGDEAELRRVLGPPSQIVGPVGPNSMAEWSFLAGQSPTRVAMSVTASLINGVPKSLTIALAFERSK